MDGKRIGKVWACVVFLTALEGCDVTQDIAVEKGKDLVASVLKDPDSAKFGRVYMVEDQAIGDTHYGLLCGEVNSKNSFGGFTGFRRFVANFSYSRRGELKVSYVTLEEGVNAELNRAGITYFEDVYWLGKCTPRPPATVVAQPETEPNIPTKTKAKPEQNAQSIKSKAVRQSPAAVASLPEPKVEKSGWAVQVASVGDQRKAQSIRDQIDSSGSPAYLIETSGVYRVFSGPYETRDKAELAMASLMKSKSMRGIVVRVGN